MRRDRRRLVHLIGPFVIALLMAIPAVGWGDHPFAGAPTGAEGGLSAAELRAGPLVSDPAGHAPLLGAGAQQLGPLPPTTSLYFTISFGPSNASELAYLIDQQETPGGPLFHHFLTAPEYLREFGPPATVSRETIGYLTSYGATYLPSGSPFTLAFRASAPVVEAAFGTPLDVYRLSNGTLGFANPRPLALPAPIAPFVSAVDGLTSFATARPSHMLAPPRAAPASRTPREPTAVPITNMSLPANWSSPGFLYSPPGPIQNTSYQFLTPASTVVAYNATQLYGLNDVGQGTTIAIVMASGYNPSDLSAYGRQTFGNSSQILGRLTPYPVAGELANASAPGGHFLTDPNAMEFAIDIEYSATMAPKARLDAVYGPSLSLASLVSDYARLTSLQPVPNVVTNSWTATEDTWWNLEGPSWQSARALENYWSELTALGSTILASSGDAGGYDALTGLLSSSLPGASPYVTAVGGARTTVADAHGAAFPAAPTYAVNQTVAQFGWSQLQSGPAWYPNATLWGSDAASVASEGYWYSSAGGPGPDYASGGLGLSQWFPQPWWQHGLGVPDSGRRMTPDIAAEADFNETFFFAGAWNFFWGGTSFSCPTVAGEVALLDTHLNSTLGPSSGRASYYLGAFDPLLYALGNDLNVSRRVYAPATTGANPWDLTELGQNMTWPAGQNWPLLSMGPAGAWNLLVGWGVPDIAALALDAPTVLRPALALRLPNGTTPSSAPDAVNYSLTVVALPSGTPVPNARVQIWVANASLVAAPPETLTLVASPSGTFHFDATVAAYVAFYLESASQSAFQSVWFYPAPLAAGALHVAVVASPSSVMGGFSAFNGFLSSAYPATGPVEPNVALVSVSYRATPTSPPVAVYDAQVLASIPTVDGFSSPPHYPNPLYNLTPLNGTAEASRSLTNLSGIALVDSWNVPSPERYTIVATYRGLNASTAYLVTPQLNVEGVGPAERYDADQYGGTPGYTGLGAQNTILAPAVLGGDRYILPVRVTDWTGGPVPSAAVDLAFPAYFGPPNMAQPIPGTETRTNATGVASFLVDSAISLDAASFGGNLTVQVFNASYPSAFLTTPVGPFPIRTNDSDATVHFLTSASTVIQIGLFGGAITTDYVGTTGAVALFTVEAEPPVVGRFNNVTALSYAVDAAPAVAVPLGTAGQNTYRWRIDLPTLALGAHQFSVTFSDAQGFTYRNAHPFWVIGAGPYPAPVVTFLSPPPAAYLAGVIPVTWSSDEGPYLRSEMLSAIIDGVVASYNVTGTSSFNLSLDGFASRTLVLRIDVENPNGLNGSASTAVYVTHQFLPTARISLPSNGSAFPAGSDVTVAFDYSGDYLQTATLALRRPNGTLSQADVSGEHAYTLGAVTPGNYTVGLTVTSTDGASASTFDYFSVYLPELVTGVTLSPSNAIVGPGGLVQFTAKATCAPAVCPDYVIYAWSTSASSLGSLTESNGRTTEFRAGGQVGSTVISVNATLPTGTLTAVGLVQVSVPSSIPSPSPVYENPYLWGGVVALLGLLCGLFLLRETRRRPPDGPPSEAGGRAPIDRWSEEPSPTSGEPSDR